MFHFKMKKKEIERLGKRIERIERFVASLDMMLFCITVLVGYGVIIWMVFS